MEPLSRLEIDSIKEVMSIGAGHASNALYLMTGKKMMVSFPLVELCPIEKVPSLIDKPEEPVAATYLSMTGEENGRRFPVGAMVFLFSQKNAIKLAAILNNEKIGDYEYYELTNMDISALEETGNILSGASLTAISKILGIKIMESMPHFANDMLQSVLNSLLAEIAPKSTDALIFKTEFHIEDHGIKGNSLILFDPDTLTMLRKRMSSLFKDMLKEYIEEEYEEIDKRVV
ncbi:MAG TPA: hypothetical protein EYP86_01115 [Candidatus Altiarchaeales archaeon]|nr:hypothetical protein [Candidatus Altiarchaeales archaeon]